MSAEINVMLSGHPSPHSGKSTLSGEEGREGPTEAGNSAQEQRSSFSQAFAGAGQKNK